MTAIPTSHNPRYQPDERPPFAIALGIALQYAILSIAPLVLFPLIVVKGAGGNDSQVSWMVFAVMAVIGLTTVLQTVRIGPFGSGFILIPILSPVTIPFCIIALVEGGPSTLAALVSVSGVSKIALSMRLSLLRRVVTPIVKGKVLILIVITVLPLLFGIMDDVPPGSSSWASPVCASVTLAVMIGILLRSSGALRLWAPAIGVGAGFCAAVAFGIHDFEALRQAPWFGFPVSGWNGLGLDFGATFWSLLQAFLLVSIASVVSDDGIATSTQRVSWRIPRAIDFRRVQWGVGSSGIGNLLAGLAGGIPMIIGGNVIPYIQQTSCASRIVGIFIGCIVLLLAFFPKVVGLTLAIPGPIFAVYLIVLLAPLFVEGMRTIMQDELDYRKGLLVAISIAVGVGFQFKLVSLPIGGLWGPMLQQGLLAGGITVILLTLFMEITGQGRRRINTELSVEALPKINKFLADFSSSRGWNAEMTERLHAVGEETLLILVNQYEDGDAHDQRRLLIIAASDGLTAELEFATAPGDAENLEDRIALLKKPVPEMPELAIERDIPLRLLRHYASSVSHRQYHDIEVITVHVVPASMG